MNQDPTPKESFSRDLPARSEFAHHWDLDPDVVFLNHGSFGACPREVRAYQQSLMTQMERELVRFFEIEAMELLTEVRADVSKFVGADPKGVAFVANATTGVNTALRALDLKPGDEVILADQEYQASRNALFHVCEEAGAVPVVTNMPFPVESEDQIVESLLSAVTTRTRFALVDHITSQTGLVLPLARIIKEFKRRGIDTIVDGAHGPGQVPLQLDEMAPAFYSGNFHKWVCSPKSGALFYVREDWRERTRPLVISHGATKTWPGRSRFHLEFDWMGTSDPTAVLSISKAMRFMEGMVEEGWLEIRRRNRKLALIAQQKMSEALEIDVPAPANMVGSMAAVPLPDDEEKGAPIHFDRFQDRLMREAKIQIPVSLWPKWPRRVLRASAQLYNSPGEYEYLADALKRLLPR